MLDVGELLRELQKTVSKTVREDVQVSVMRRDLGRIEPTGASSTSTDQLVINAQTPCQRRTLRSRRQT